MPRSTTLLILAAVLVGFTHAQVSPPPIADPSGGDETRKAAPEKPFAKGIERPGSPQIKQLNGNGNGHVNGQVTKPVIPGGPAPKITCANPSYDFGEAGQNEEIIHDYEIRNSGEGDLEIVGVNKTCGCTSAEAAKKLLKPGETTTVNVKLNTQANNGPLSKSVTVTTNDPTTPNYVLTISGRVAQPFRPAVTEVNFGSIKKGTPVESKTFEILTNSSQSIVDIKTDLPDHVKATYELLPVGEKKQGYKIVVKLEGMLPVGQLRSMLSLTTTVAAQKTIQIPVLAIVEGEINLKPRTFNFGKVKRGEDKTYTVEIEKSGAADLKIENVQVKPEGAYTAKLEEVAAGKSYKIVLAIAPEAKDGYSRGTVSIKTNVPGETDLQVFFYALVQP